MLRGTPNAHSKDIISGDYAHNLGLIATGSRDKTVKVWDYERVQVQHTITAHRSEVNIVKFLKPFPLLLTADQSGVLHIWLTKPKVNDPKLILTWRNSKNVKEQPPITAVDSYYHREPGQAIEEGQFMLFIGDEAGKVTVQDLSAILKKIENL